MQEASRMAVISAKEFGEKYDESCKRLFMNREILAPILKYLVQPFESLTIEEIIKCIEPESITISTPVEDIPVEIKGLPTELISTLEKTIRYDVKFKAKIPKGDWIFVNLEIQNDYKPSNPKYPITKRAIYYISRGISNQLGRLTETTNYNDIKKEYSIWICNENVPKKEQNTVSRYHIQKEDIIGTVKDNPSEYNLMEIIIVRRGGDDNSKHIFDYLNGVFNSDITTMEKHIGTISKTAKEDIKMFEGLGEAKRQEWLKEGRQEGIKIGQTSMSQLIKKLLDDNRIDDLKKITEDEELLNQLMKEYNID